MTTTNGSTETRPLREQLQEARQRRRLLEEQLAARHLQSLLEITGGADPGWDRYGDLWIRGRLTDPSDPGAYVPPDRPSDRAGGMDWPLYRTELELGRIRMRSKLLASTNAYARGLLRNLVNYVVGDGCQYEVLTKEDLPDADPAAGGRQAPAGLEREVARAQDVVDAFLQANRWNASADRTGEGPAASTRERESVRRVVRDGEAILRLYFEEGGTTRVRWVEPAQLLSPPGAPVDEEWMFGIRHEAGDEEDRLEYHVAYKSTEDSLRRGVLETGERVPAAEIVHLTGPDTDAVLSRGLPEFSYDTADALERAAQLERNASAGAAFRAALAMIWQHHYGTADQISALAAGQAAAMRQSPITGRVDLLTPPRPGTVFRVDAGQELVANPPDQTGSYLAGVQGDLRQAASAVCAPEYLASGDASNANYASTREAGTPFIQQAKALQSYFTTAFKRVLWKVLEHAAASGLISPDALDLLDIKVEPAALVHRNDLEKARRDEVLVGLGVVDRSTISAEWGYDPQVVQDGILKWNDTMTPQGLTPQALGAPTPGTVLPHQPGKSGAGAPGGNGAGGGGGLPR